MNKLLSIFACLLLFAACRGDKKENSQAAKTTENPADQVVTLSPRQLSSVGIKVGQPEYTQINSSILLQGTVDVPPGNKIDLSFPVGAFVKSTDMLPGKRVRKGDILAVVEDIGLIQLQQDYLTAVTNELLAQTEFERQQELNTSKASSDKVFQQAKAEMERQKILVSSLRAKLAMVGIDAGKLSAATLKKDIPLRSPVNGFVSKVNVSVGKYTAATDVLFELIDPSDIHLSLKVLEKDLPHIAIGDQVSAYANNNPQKKFAARILLISKAFDEHRMVEIHCHFDQYDPALVPGMFMNAVVLAEGVPALVVPEDAIVRWQNQSYVFVEQQPGQYLMTPVSTGVQQDGRQQIEGAGIDVNTKLVVTSAFALLMKIKNKEGEG